MEARKASVLAQDILDLYYQDFTDDNEAYFDLDFALRQVEYAYAFLCNEEYKRLYEQARRDGIAQMEIISFDSQWLKREKVKLIKDTDSKLFIAKTSYKPYTFLYDKNNIGIQDVQADDCNLIRSTTDRSWIRKRHLPDSDVVYWWAETRGDDGVIVFDKDCCKEVFVFYIPGINKDLEVQPEMAFQIQTMVYNVMAQARQGVVIDSTNDSNRNAVAQTEVNKEAVK